jgi:hypothetical protein
MTHSAAVCRFAGHVIHDLIGRLVEARRARQPNTSEAQVHAEVWEALREHAHLDDPNHLEPTSSFVAVWVLTALLDLENDARPAPSAEPEPVLSQHF